MIGSCSASHGAQNESLGRMDAVVVEKMAVLGPSGDAAAAPASAVDAIKTLDADGRR